MSHSRPDPFRVGQRFYHHSNFELIWEITRMSKKGLVLRYGRIDKILPRSTARAFVDSGQWIEIDDPL